MNMKVEEQDEMENPGLFDESSNYLQGTINRHEQSQPFATKGKVAVKRGTQEIENKHIDIKIGEVNLAEQNVA